MKNRTKKIRVTCLKAACAAVAAAPFTLTVVTVLQWMPKGPTTA